MSDVASFGFRAMRRDGTVEAGVIEAPSRAAAVSLIVGRGTFPIKVSEERRSGARRLRANAEDLAMGLRALASLLGSGLSISRSLAVLEELTPASWAPAIPQLRERVERGEHLSAALGASQLPFPPHVIGVIEAGEAGSDLGQSVDGAARLLESRAAARAALRNALAYPLMLAVAGSLSVALLVGVVLPRFVGLLTDAGQALPAATRLVLGFGVAVRSSWWALLFAVVVVIAAWRTWVARPSGLLRWHAFLLRLPVVRRVRQSAGTANGFAALAALLQAGVPLAAALPHAARATGDRALAEGLLAARERVVTGDRFARALETETKVTPAALRFARIGEETGELAAMLASAADIEGAHALRRLQRLIRMVEPTMILVFGLVVMLIAAALLQAMYGLRP